MAVFLLTQHHKDGFKSRNNRGLAGCHGNGAQVGWGDFGGSLCRRDGPPIKKTLSGESGVRVGQSPTSEARVGRRQISLSVSQSVSQSASVHQCQSDGCFAISSQTATFIVPVRRFASSVPVRWLVALSVPLRRRLFSYE